MRINFTRVSNDTNGNPRYVCHYFDVPASSYSEALALCKPLGGKKFHNKQFGGGIVFTTYDLKSLEKSILELSNK